MHLESGCRLAFSLLLLSSSVMIAQKVISVLMHVEGFDNIKAEDHLRKTLNTLSSDHSNLNTCLTCSDISLVS